MNHPKLVHRIWLGDREAPYPDFSDRWQSLYPDWLVYEWHDADVAGLDLVLAEEFAAAPSVVHRADILAVEVVARFGGMLAGWDMEPVRNLELLIGESEGWCTPDEEGWPGGALFGARPNHPALLAVLAEIHRHTTTEGWDPDYPNLDTGPYRWNAALGHGRAAELGFDVLGTTRTAYPISSAHRHLARDVEHMARLRADPDVYAIHHFAGSWINV